MIPLDEQHEYDSVPEGVAVCIHCLQIVSPDTPCLARKSKKVAIVEDFGFISKRYKELKGIIE